MADSKLTPISSNVPLMVIGAVAAITSLMTVIYFAGLFIFYDFFQYIEYFPTSYWAFVVSSFIGAAALGLAAEIGRAHV